MSDVRRIVRRECSVWQPFSRVPTKPPRSPRRKPGDSGWHDFPFAIRCGFEPGRHVTSCGMDDGVVFVPGVPGFPPGASCGTVPKKLPASARGHGVQRG